jgi:outer membrane protein
VQKEAPAVQQYQQKIEEKSKSLDAELQQAQQSMSAEDFQKKQQQALQERQIFAASMQRQFMTDIQSKLGDIAKDKNVGIIVYKEVVPNGGVDVTDDLIAKLQ